MGKKKRKKKLKKRKNNNNTNISEAIVKITDSFIENNLGECSHPYEFILKLSIIGWNMSLFPQTSQEELYGMIAELLPDNFNADGVAGVVDIIDRIVAEKRRFYPGVKRMILSHNISKIEEGKIKLDVNSAPISELRESANI